VFDALPDARNQGLESMMKMVYDTGELFYANEHPVNLFRNGRLDTVYQNFVYQPYYDSRGNILGVLAISVDVTAQVFARQKTEEIILQRTSELAEANQALTKNNEELQRLNANLEHFAYAASHDLKEPLRKIHIFSDQLKNELDSTLSDSQKWLFDRLENAARRMTSLVDDLLTYSQTARGFGEQETVDLNKKVQLVLEDLEVEIQQSNAEIIVDPLPTIRGSKRQIQQLFQNLITNALKYKKPNSSAFISIKCREVMGYEILKSPTSDESTRPFNLITVKDNGIGFHEADAKRIFNVFTRLHANTEYRGTGVGLSIAQKVVENHDGHIWAEGIPGEGAAFYILLPMR